MPIQSSEPPGALTTIFTPPSDCFHTLPTSWSGCLAGSPPPCYWPISSTCYPTGGQVYTDHFGAGLLTTASNLSSNPIITQWINYSPGFMPLGFQPDVTGNNEYGQYSYGCFTGWNKYGNAYCTMFIPTATYSLSGPNPHTGPITAVMPAVAVTWTSSDLSKFTPASAPILPAPSITSFEQAIARSKSQAAARSRSQATAQSSSKIPIKTTQAGNGTQGLSRGAEAGIAVAAGVVALACMAIGFWLLRRRRKRNRGNGVMRTESKKPYLDKKAELDDNAAHELGGPDPRELAADRIGEPSAGRGAENSSRPPPIPYASKPRGRSELDAGFTGHGTRNAGA